MLSHDRAVSERLLSEVVAGGNSHFHNRHCNADVPSTVGRLREHIPEVFMLWLRHKHQGCKPGGHEKKFAKHSTDPQSPNADRMPKGDAEWAVKSDCNDPGAQGEECYSAGGHCFY